MQLTLLIASWLVAAWAIATLFLRAGFPASTPIGSLVLALPLAPQLQSLALTYAFRYLPGHPRWLYVAVIEALLALPLLIWPRTAMCIADGVWERPAQLLAHVRDGWRRDYAVSLVALGGAIIYLLLIAQVLTLPAMSSDPLEYMAMARIIYTDVSMVRYPLDVADANGLYLRSAHPPAFHMMLVWTYIFQGDAVSSLFPRFIQLYYVSAFLLLMAWVMQRATGDRFGGTAGIFACVLALCVPIYPNLATQLHVDPMRITLYGLAFVVMAELCVRVKQGAEHLAVPAALTGSVLGASMAAHSIGILALPFVGLCYLLLCWRLPFTRFLVIGALVAALALLLGTGQFVDNMIRFGVPLHDAEPIWDMPLIDDKTDVRYRREMVTLWDRLVNGLGVWLFAGPLFRFVHVVPIVLGVFIWREARHSIHAKVFLIGLLSYYAAGLALMLVGSDLMIKNFRYMLTLLPFVVFFGGWSLARCYERANELVDRTLQR